jgi:3-hydroxymyristoyl/3-hydroxydecanoyl-(acyl carrier protein) dehydratase
MTAAGRPDGVQPVAGEGHRTSRVLAVPGDGPWFAGHFPGRPILPGVAALTLVADALGCGVLAGVAHARFRSTIAPGERLALDARPEAPGRTRVALLRGAATVLGAVLIHGEPTPGPRAAARGEAPVADLPAPETLLPHRLPMRFVTSVLALHDDGAECVASVPAACALVRAEVAPAVAVIEAAAQTAAVWEALRRRDGAEAGPREGYLVAWRDVALHRRDVPADASLVARVRLAAVAMPLTQYRAEVSLDGETVMQGTIGTVLA